MIVQNYTRKLLGKRKRYPAGLLYVLVRALQHKDSKYNCLLINGLTALVGWRF